MGCYRIIKKTILKKIDYVFQNSVKFSKSKRHLELKYEIIKFPDGQQNVKITSMLFPEIAGVESVTIKSRLNNFRDLEIIICANQALKEIGFKSVDLYVPYFIGSRSVKKSATGLLSVFKNDVDGKYELYDHCDWERENQGELKTIYLNGEFKNRTTLEDVRNRLKESLKNS